MNAREALHRAADGDLSAFESLYEEHVAFVYAIALRILRDKMRAEDVTQSVFVRILRAPEAFHDGNFTGWISRVTRNCAVDELRRARRSPALLDYAVDRNGGAAADDIAVTLADADRACCVLAALPPQKREALELAFFGGLTHLEIAEKTGAPLGTVKTRIRTGLAEIRKALKAGTAP